MPAMSSDLTPATELRVAAVLDEGLAKGEVDDLLSRIADRQKAQGRSLCGLLMRSRPSPEGCSDMVLVDIVSAEEYLVSQPLGASSGACRADPQGFARASGVLRQALAARPDLVIVNRFGGLEAEGGGFAAELLDLMGEGLPVLTAVAPRHLEAWTRFSGGTTLLKPDEAEVSAWIERSCGGSAA